MSRSRNREIKKAAFVYNKKDKSLNEKKGIARDKRKKIEDIHENSHCDN